MGGSQESTVCVRKWVCGVSPCKEHRRFHFENIGNKVGHGWITIDIVIDTCLGGRHV